MSNGSPVRLRVAYRRVESVIEEFTRSVGLGTVTLDSLRALPVGTQFIFEMVADGIEQPIEVHGTVVQIIAAQGRFLLTIRYLPGPERGGLDAMLIHIFNTHRADRIREFARVPLQIRATEETPYSPAFLIKDFSMGGMGVEVEAPTLPRSVQLGSPFLAEVWTRNGCLTLHGEVAWVAKSPEAVVRWTQPRFGIHFGRLREDTRSQLDTILQLQALPPPPWKARVSFGKTAVERMP
ncbi:MAG: PilZ domain-containing protein [Myxococcaceae bacterium]